MVLFRNKRLGLLAYLFYFLFFILFPKFYKHVGFIRTIADGIVTIFGLDSVRYGEMIIFSNYEVGVILSLENSIAAAIVLGSDAKLIPGDFVFRTQKLMGIYVSGALLGSIVSPLGRSLSTNKIVKDNLGLGKYINFRDLFSIFFIDFSIFKNIAAYDLNFDLKEESLVKEKYVLGFMADYSKFLTSKKTFSIFMDVKDFFKSDDIQFIKSEIRSRKLFNFIFEIKTNSPLFNRSKNIRS